MQIDFIRLIAQYNVRNKVSPFNRLNRILSGNPILIIHAIIQHLKALLHFIYKILLYIYTKYNFSDNN